MSRTLLVTGGAGFIGTNFVLDAVLHRSMRVITLDALTYAGHRDNLGALDGNPDHVFVHGDIGDRPLVTRLLSQHQPDGIVHFAAESHVDRSIDVPADFIRTNIVGTFELLEATLAHLATLSPAQAGAFRFLHVSTDEVFGSLGEAGGFDERTPYAPSSPYAASKASADMLVRAYHHTYGLPVLTSNASNNYGPFQMLEKLVPMMIQSALAGRPLPVYGDGGHVRDWLFVGDHGDALHSILQHGRIGETYLVGSRTDRRNIHLVESLCRLLDELAPASTPYRDLITFVPDRPGHDRRYAVDPSKIERELGWRPRHTFEEGLRKTVRWYLDHPGWCERQAAAGALARRGVRGGVLGR